MNEFNNMSYSAGRQISESQIASYLTKVMGWMALGLLTTFVAAILCLTSTTFLNLLISNRFVYYAIIIAELAVVVGMSAAVNKISAGMATVMFMAYSALTGVTMSILCLLFMSSSIFMIFVLTAAIFLTMALYGYVTKRDMTRFGSIAVFGLIGLVLAGVVNMFLGSSVLDFIICVAGVLLFIGLTAYDTQKIKGIYVRAMEAGYGEDSEHLRKASIYGALTLYLDFINLFIMLLRLFGKRR